MPFRPSAVAVATILLLSGGAFAYASRTPRANDILVVSPASGLSESATVRVHLRGFAPGRAVQLLQCDAEGVLCGYEEARRVTTDRRGDADAELSVTRRFVGRTDLPSAALIDCRSDQCAVAVLPDGKRKSTVREPIRFR